MRTLWKGLLIALLVLASACQANNTNNEDQRDDGTGNNPAAPQALIEVDFFTEPADGISVGDEITLVAQVSQEGEPVLDAEQVRFEVWHEEDEQDNGEGEQGEEGHHTADTNNDGGQGNNDNHSDHEGDNNGDSGNDHDHNTMENYESEHDMIDGDHRDDGHYVAAYTFDRSGVYYVMYHVDARGYHAMTSHEVIVE